MQYRTPPKSVERRSQTRQRGREERNHRSVSPCSSNNASSRRAFSADLRHVDFSWYSLRLRLRPDRLPPTVLRVAVK
ncbi:hypothetical protein OPV22_018422 [Ensete ventricosum]|uniref:Uncharacterized protein n=1 Tax=Ensete ventricosum TaxID=4639 RepID=A0AAV8R391_ENSVE|nr:hypothetical protein OPV22_018422 [Ensete ventricosum]